MRPFACRRAGVLPGIATAFYGRQGGPGAIRSRHASPAFLLFQRVRGIPVSRAAVVANPTKFDDLGEFRSQVAEVMAEHGWSEPLWLDTTADDPGPRQGGSGIIPQRAPRTAPPTPFGRRRAARPIDRLPGGDTITMTTDTVASSGAEERTGRLRGLGRSV